MGAEHEAQGFGGVEGVAVADGAVFAVLVHFADGVPVGFVVGLRGFFGWLGGSGIVGCGFLGVCEFLRRGRFAGVFRVCSGFVGGGRVGDVECVLKIAGRVLLGHVEGIEVPKASFDKTAGRLLEVARTKGGRVPICWHLFETHLEENLA